MLELKEVEVAQSTFALEGLDCADCAAKLEQAVTRLPGVATAQVIFASGKLVVRYDSRLQNPAAIAATVAAMGYRAVCLHPAAGSGILIQSVFHIIGLDCADCAAKLEKKIAGLEGVAQASLNFGAGKLSVEHMLPPDKLVAVIREAGYQTAEQTAQSAGRVWWRESRAVLTLVSGLLLGAAFIADRFSSAGWPAFLYIAAMVTGGYYTARAGWYGVKSFTLDTNALMVIAVIGAVAIGEWSEGATVVFLFALGNWLQSYTVDKTRQSIRALMDLTPPVAWIRRQAQELCLPVGEVRVGDVMLVKPGEKIALDGVVRQGTSAMNQAAITGESIPVDKQAGDTVFAGTVNGEGLLEVVVTKLAADTTLARIIHLVEEAQARKAPLQQYVDKFARYYTPAVIAGAAAMVLVPWLIFGQPPAEWLYRALTLLVISCPCALVISTPVSIVSAIGVASKQGVLIKGGVYLEQISTIKAIAFDKTGTLTKGALTVTDIIPQPGHDEAEVLRLAAAIEKWSEHPIGRAVVAKAEGLALPAVADFQALPGRGARARLGETWYYIGNRRLFCDMGFCDLPLARETETLEGQGKTVMLLGSEREILGAVAVADTLRESGAANLAKLRETGVAKLVMLTGDNPRAAGHVAATLGIDEVYSELLPEDKAGVIETLLDKYGQVVMVGDGVNDAPALAKASVGIAMGTAGADAALEAADIALMSDDLGKLAPVIRLGRRTVRIIKQNVYFSVGIKLAFVILTLFGFSNLWMAVFADTGAAILVTLNGMRLMRWLADAV